MPFTHHSFGHAEAVHVDMVGNDIILVVDKNNLDSYQIGLRYPYSCSQREGIEGPRARLFPTHYP